MSRRVVVVAALIERGDRFLVSRRGSGSFEGYWEFPGGKRERGEGDRAALRRELREELGIAVRIGERVHTAKAGPLQLRFFRCGWLERQRPRPYEVETFRWVRRDELPGHRFPPADRELIAALAKGEI